ncbi:UNVERIFIED_ORG: signal transduction histidine kinase [Arthrobacter sp. UYCu721]
MALLAVVACRDRRPDVTAKLETTTSLVNLLSNARKHTPPGTTVVTAVTKSADGSATVTVTDDGGGIPAEFVDQVFSRFARADAARKGTTPASGAGASEGTIGLGLSMVQSIMEAHGGSVEVTSRAGRTEFALFLPAGAVARPATSERSKATRRHCDSCYQNVT